MVLLWNFLNVIFFGTFISVRVGISARLIYIKFETKIDLLIELSASLVMNMKLALVSVSIDLNKCIVGFYCSD